MQLNVNVQHVPIMKGSIMSPRVVNVPSTETLIKTSPGFKKKELSDYKIDLMALCGFGCRYCSSNRGNYLRINWKHGAKFKSLAEKQLGRKVDKKEFPNLTFEFPDVLPKLEEELKKKPAQFGKGKEIVFVQLTEGFSPNLVENGTTRKALDLLLEHTAFRIRVLTKNAVVGEFEWIDYFLEHHDRFTVGLSVGSLDDRWSKKMEIRTSQPSKRFTALSNLQGAGVSTFGMLCPVFPDVVKNNQVEELIERINPTKNEFVWAEPYNDRDNWRVVRDSFDKNSKTYTWFNHVYKDHKKEAWSEYAMELYQALIAHANSNGWTDKLKYLLYESNLTDDHAKEMCDAPGILFQSINKKGISSHPVIAATQLNVDIEDSKEVKKINGNIIRAMKTAQKAWLEIGKQMLALQDKIESMGTGVKRKALWQYYFKVDSQDEYCTKKLRISRETVYQMMFAVKWIRSTRPKLLEGPNYNIPHYTNFRVLKPHFEKIESDQDKYTDLIELSYTGTRTDLTEKTQEVFSSTPIDASYEDVFDIEAAIKTFKKTIMDHIDSDKENAFIAKIEELENLLLE